MPRYRLLLGILAFATALPLAAANIYKTVDDEGNVVFTDVPPKDAEDTVELSRGNTFTPPTPAAPASIPQAATSGSADEPAAEPAMVAYSSLRIMSPSHDEAIRENAGNLSITASLSPSLDPDHRLQVLVDGHMTAEGPSLTVSLANVDRGSHALMVQVVDAGGNVLIASPPVTFHMLRASAARSRPGG